MTISIDKARECLEKGDFPRARAAYEDFILSAEYAPVDGAVLGAAYYGALLAAHDCKNVLELRATVEVDITDNENYKGAMKHLDDEHIQSMLWQVAQDIKEKAKKKVIAEKVAVLSETQRLIETDMHKAEHARRERKRKRTNAEEHIAQVKMRRRYNKEFSKKVVGFVIVGVLLVCAGVGGAYVKISYDDAVGDYTEGNYAAAVPKFMSLSSFPGGGVGESSAYLAAYYGKTIAAGKYHSVIIRRAGKSEGVDANGIDQARSVVNNFFDRVEALQNGDLTVLDKYATPYTSAQVGGSAFVE
ncbi:hypothetical protein FACS1894133_7320 [Clostridia bacterium]|nr:hypothetical protein FACS1894133_7320 [Clostridia bacterium]